MSINQKLQEKFAQGDSLTEQEYKLLEACWIRINSINAVGSLWRQLPTDRWASLSATLLETTSFEDAFSFLTKHAGALTGHQTLTWFNRHATTFFRLNVLRLAIPVICGSPLCLKFLILLNCDTTISGEDEFGASDQLLQHLILAGDIDREFAITCSNKLSSRYAKSLQKERSPALACLLSDDRKAGSSVSFSNLALTLAATEPVSLGSLSVIMPPKTSVAWADFVDKALPTLLAISCREDSAGLFAQDLAHFFMENKLIRGAYRGAAQVMNTLAPTRPEVWSALNTMTLSAANGVIARVMEKIPFRKGEADVAIGTLQSEPSAFSDFNGFRDIAIQFLGFTEFDETEQVLGWICQTIKDTPSFARSKVLPEFVVDMFYALTDRGWPVRDILAEIVLLTWAAGVTGSGSARIQKSVSALFAERGLLSGAKPTETVPWLRMLQSVAEPAAENAIVMVKLFSGDSVGNQRVLIKQALLIQDESPEFDTSAISTSEQSEMHATHHVAEAATAYLAL